MLNNINEVTRKNMVGKTKSQSPSRYNKRLDYRVNDYAGIDPSQLISNDILATKVSVGDYECIVAYKGVLSNLKDIVKRQPKHNVTLQSVIRAVNTAIDDTDILVDCTCPDFQYRFAYLATKYGYKYGKPETRPANITNPDDDKGAMCKHLTMLLSNKRWLIKLSTIVNDFIKANIESVRKALNVSEDDFFINDPGRPSRHTNRNLGMTKDYGYGYDSSYTDSIDDTDDNITDTEG